MRKNNTTSIIIGGVSLALINGGLYLLKTPIKAVIKKIQNSYRYKKEYKRIESEISDAVNYILCVDNLKEDIVIDTCNYKYLREGIDEILHQEREFINIQDNPEDEKVIKMKEYLSDLEDILDEDVSIDIFNTDLPDIEKYLKVDISRYYDQLVDIIDKYYRAKATFQIKKLNNKFIPVEETENTEENDIGLKLDIVINERKEENTNEGITSNDNVEQREDTREDGISDESDSDRGNDGFDESGISDDVPNGKCEEK